MRRLFFALLVTCSIALATRLNLITSSGGGLTFSNDHSGLFNGTNIYVDIGTGFNPNGSSAFTVTAWINRPNATAVTNGGAILGNWNSTGAGFSAEDNGGGGFAFDLMQTPATNAIATFGSTGIPSANTWYCVAWTYDGSKSASGVKVWSNGTQFSQSTFWNSFTGSSTASGSTTIGARNGTTQYENAYITQLTVWNIALSSGQMTSVCGGAHPVDNSTLAFFSNAIHWYQFSTLLSPPDTDTGTIFDRIGSANGTPVNTSAGFLTTTIP